MQCFTFYCHESEHNLYKISENYVLQKSDPIAFITTHLISELRIK